MEELAKILQLFVTTKSGNEAWKEYHEAYPAGYSRAVFYRKLEILVARDALRRTMDGYERPNKAADFWIMLFHVSNWLKLEGKDRLGAQYMFHAVGNNDPDTFIKNFRAFMDEHNVLATFDFLRTLYETPKIGLSWIAMQWDMDDPDQSTRQGLLQSVRETFSD